MQNLLGKASAFMAALLLPGVGAASTISYTGSASFTSDAEPPIAVSLPSFNTFGGTFTLTGVTVKITHSASVLEIADNDDPFKTASVRARMIRAFDADGPDFPTNFLISDSRTMVSPTVGLAVDDGDLTMFDGSAPDGHNFGTLSYTNDLAATLNPSVLSYATLGPGNVNFNITPTQMINDLQFFGIPPDRYQLQVTAPELHVFVDVTYNYTPEPATLALLGCGFLGMLRRIRR